jgi:hypothetical protein
MNKRWVTNPRTNVADQSTRRRDDRRRPPFLPFFLWIWLAYIDVKFWFLTVPAAIVLAMVGWHGADWLGGLRWAAYSAAALLALPFPAAAWVLVIRKIDADAHWRRLDRDETVAGLQLPAGSRIRFHDKAHASVDSIDLPYVTDILGMRLVGSLKRYDKWGDIDQVWSGTLAEDQPVNGLPCRARAVLCEKDTFVFDQDGIVQRCTLAAHDLLGLKLPPRTTVLERGNDNKPWRLLLPPDAGVYIPALATTAPPGVTLSVANDGRLEGIGSGHGQTIIVRGLPLNSMNFDLQGEQVVSELAEPFFVAGEMRQAGTGVRIDLPTGTLQFRARDADNETRPSCGAG